MEFLYNEGQAERPGDTPETERTEEDEGDTPGGMNRRG